MKRMLVSDMFGFPLADGYFDGGIDSVIEIITDKQVQNASDLTAAFHVRPMSLKNSVLLQIGFNENSLLSLKMSSLGNLSVT